MRLCALIYSKITKITSVDDMTQIMIVGIQLYSSLSLLARQSMLMLTELPGMVTVSEQFFHLEYSDSYTCNIHHHCVCHSQVTAFETLLALNYNSFIFLLWIGTDCISCVVQQTSGVRDLSSLVRYDDSSLAAIRHVQSIIPVVRPRPKYTLTQRLVFCVNRSDSIGFEDQLSC